MGDVSGPALLFALLGLLAGCPGGIGVRSAPPQRDPSVLGTSGPARNTTLELVESVPLQTSWDQPDLRQTAQVWLEMIDGARRTLEVAQFYIANQKGEALEPVIADLEAAARRGVRLRVLVEKKFLGQSQKTLDRLARRPNVQIAVFDIGPLTGGILHAKYLIVDGQEAFVGSQNMDWRALVHIHELGLRVHDAEVVGTLGLLFEADWRRATGQPPPSTGPDRDRDGLPDALDPRPGVPTWAPRRGPVGRLYLVASPPLLTPPGVPLAGRQLLRLLDQAKESVVVQLLSYSLTGHGGLRWTRVDRALRRAAARGVKVRMNLSHWCKGPKVKALQDLARLPNITIKLNTIPAHSGGFIPYARVDHCKYMVVDGRVGWLGTSNWSGDYFTASRNVEVVFTARDPVAKLARIFEQGWRGPYVEDLDPDRAYAKPRRR